MKHLIIQNMRAEYNIEVKAMLIGTAFFYV